MTKLEEELVRDEGEVLHAYKDSLGYLTIGVGQLIDPKRGGGISQAASRFILRESINGKAAELDKAIPWWNQLSGPRRRVILNMAFNLGTAGLLEFKNTLSAVKAGDFAAAADGILASKAAQQAAGRYHRLADMMRAG